MVLVSFCLSFLLCCNVLRLVSEKLEEKGGKRKCSRFFFFNFFKIDCFEVYERKMKIAAQLSFFPPRSKQQKGKSFLSYVSFVFAATKHVFPLNLFFFPLYRRLFYLYCFHLCSGALYFGTRFRCYAALSD